MHGIIFWQRNYHSVHMAKENTHLAGHWQAMPNPSPPVRPGRGGTSEGSEAVAWKRRKEICKGVNMR